MKKQTDEQKRAKANARKRAWYAAHREQECERSQLYYIRHREEILERHAEWYERERLERNHRRVMARLARFGFFV